jgi:hypothetical protein
MQLEHAMRRKIKRVLSKEQANKIRRLNKDRAKRMEKDVTQKLNGRRTPMSGAGFIKGDGIVYLPHNQGIAMVECKVSSVTDKKGPYINVYGTWLLKLREDTQAMQSIGARFGFFVWKFLHVTPMFVLIPEASIPVVEETLGLVVPLQNDTIFTLGTGYTRFGSMKVHLTVLQEYGRLTAYKHGEYRIVPFSIVQGWFRTNEEV